MVKKKVQKHFECFDNDVGIPLQNDNHGNNEHWEKTTIFEDVMTLDFSNGKNIPKLTEFTLAFLHDTGKFNFKI